jgi:chromate transporter
LGATAFGGPAMVPYIGKMAVERSGWLDENTFREGVALCQTIPGATAMQTTAYVGFKVRGLAGAAVSFIGFGFPAFLLMIGLSAFYARSYTLTPVVAVFDGLQTIVVAIVANATVSFGKTSLKGFRDVFIALLAYALQKRLSTDFERRLDTPIQLHVASFDPFSCHAVCVCFTFSIGPEAV